MFASVHSVTVFTADMEELPTLPELMRFGSKSINIIEEIGVNYHNFGVNLLEDKTGNRMRALERQLRDNPEDINRTVLSRWINGEGREPRSWATLAIVLDECKLTTLTNEILTVKGKQGECI